MKTLLKYLAALVVVLIVGIGCWGVFDTRLHPLDKESLPPQTAIVESGSPASRVQLFLLRRASNLLNAFVDMETVSIADIRQFRQSLEEKREPRPGVIVEAMQHEGLDAMRYTLVGTDAQASSDFVILSFHGGAYASGTPTSPYQLNANLLEATGWPVIAPRYRLAPEHPYPAAVDDAERAYRSVLQSHSASQIFITGESAGGGLALALMLRMKSKGLPMPRAAVLFSPWTDVSLTAATIESHRGRDFLNPAEVARWGRAYHASTPVTHPEISPLFGDLSGLPPTLLMAGSEEIILDDSIRLQQKLIESGVDSQLQIWRGMWHIWPNAEPDAFPEVRDSIAQCAEFFQRHSTYNSIRQHRGKP